MANIPAQLYRGDSDYLGTISNVDGQILFDSDKKEIFVDDGTTRESYGGGAGDKTYATFAQAEADIANISEKDTVFVKEGTSASLTQRVDDLEDEVEQINTDLSDIQSALSAQKIEGFTETTSGEIRTITLNDQYSSMNGCSISLFSGANAVIRDVSFTAPSTITFKLHKSTDGSVLNTTITVTGIFLGVPE